MMKQVQREEAAKKRRKDEEDRARCTTRRSVSLDGLEAIKGTLGVDSDPRVGTAARSVSP